MFYCYMDFRMEQTNSNFLGAIIDFMILEFTYTLDINTIVNNFIKVYRWLAPNYWFSSATHVSSTNKTICHEWWYDWNIVESVVKHSSYNILQNLS